VAFQPEPPNTVEAGRSAKRAGSPNAIKVGRGVPRDPAERIKVEKTWVHFIITTLNRRERHLLERGKKQVAGYVCGYHTNRKKSWSSVLGPGIPKVLPLCNGGNGFWGSIHRRLLLNGASTTVGELLKTRMTNQNGSRQHRDRNQKTGDR